MNIAFSNHMLHRVVGFEQHGDLIRRQSAGGLLDARVYQDGLARHLLNDAAGAGDDGSLVARRHNVYIGLELQLVAVRIVVRSLGRAGGLGAAEVDDLVGLRDSCLLIERQVLGQQMNRIL